MVPKNICVAFLGFDSDRIFLPYAEYRCNKLYLIKRGQVDHETAEYNYGLIKEKIPAEEIDERFVPSDIFLRINCLREIFESEKENRIFVNVSTGSKLDAIAGMLAVMLFHKVPREITPFYVHPKTTGRYLNAKHFSETEGVKRIDEVPILDFQKPENGVLESLRILADQGGVLKKQELVENLCKRNLVESYSYIDGVGIVKKDIAGDVLNMLARGEDPKRSLGTRKYIPGAIHYVDTNIFSKLKKPWSAIEIEERPKNKRVRLTKNGEILCSMLFGKLIGRVLAPT